jgi:hypothetical protein
MSPTGYTSPDYVASLAEYGRPVQLPQSGGFLLERTIPGTSECDAIGPYPLFCCSDWSGLQADLANLEGRLVSVVLVTDPFGPVEPFDLAPAFNHGLLRYKDHSVIDLEVPLDQTACPHHRRNARKANRSLAVEEITEPLRFVDTWCGLYAELIARHELTGICCFSRKAFEAQLAVPGLVALRAIDKDCSTAGMVLWYCQGDVGYYHLAAYSPRGYAEMASYALFWASAERLRGRLRWLCLGAGAGVRNDGSDGLTRFKRGWSALVRPTYLGRHVACAERYAELCRGQRETDFFPAYRAGVDRAA